MLSLDYQYKIFYWLGKENNSNEKLFLKYNVAVRP